MRDVVLWVGLAILGTALALLLLFGGSGSVAGLESESFARLASLTAIALLIGAALVRRHSFGGVRLWHVAVWLAALVLLMAGYQAYQGGAL